MEKNKFKGTIYQDQYILVVNKPSGLLTVPVGEKGQNDLTSMLNGLKGSDERELIYPCHRLDKETSGVIVFAKGRAVQQNMMDQFRNKEIQKAYIAFVQGKIKQTNGILKNYIQGAWPYKKQGPAKLAITKFRLLYKNNDLSVLEVEPVTGRTNQIRIQFKMIGHPLVGGRHLRVPRTARAAAEAGRSGSAGLLCMP